MDDLEKRDPEAVREAFREFLRRLAKAVRATLTASERKGQKGELRPRVDQKPCAD